MPFVESNSQVLYHLHGAPFSNKGTYDYDFFFSTGEIIAENRQKTILIENNI